MNANSENSQQIPCRLRWSPVWKRIRMSLVSKRSFQLLGFIAGLFLIGSNDQTFAQAPAPSLPVEWVSLVESGDVESDAADASLSKTSVPDNVLSERHLSLSLQNPLANLRQPDPSDLLTKASAAEKILGNTNYSNRQNRDEPTLVIGWNQPKLRHRRLYFEDQEIERGNAQRQFPNVTAGGNFVKSLFAFPVRLVTGR